MKEEKVFILSEDEFEELHFTILPYHIDDGMTQEDRVKLWENETGLSWLFHYDKNKDIRDACFLVVDEKRLILARLKYGF